MDELDSDNHSLEFGDEIAETVLSVGSGYRTAPLKMRLPYIDSFFYESVQLSRINKLIILALSGLCAVIASLPLTAYEGFLPFIEWDFTAILRAIAFGVICLNVWVTIFRSCWWWAYPYITDDPINQPDPEDFPGIGWVKRLTGFFFSLLYASLYAWKWYNLQNVPLGGFSVVMFLISSTGVFYRLIYKQLSNTTTTHRGNRQRHLLLQSLKVGYINNTKNHIITNTVADHLHREVGSAFSLMVAVHNDRVFTNTEDQVIQLCEESYYDRYQYIRVSITNLGLGMACLGLWMTMIEDYGHSIASTLPLTEEGYLWFVSVVCFWISCFYILCSYNLVHQTLRSVLNFIRCKRSLLIFRSFCLKLPALTLGILMASVRMNASYITFGRIAAKYHLPPSIGFTLIYLGVGIIFLLDMIASTRLLHSAIQSLLTVVDWEWCAGCYYGKIWSNRMLVRYYHLKARTLVKDASESGLAKLSTSFVCRLK
jgi:hypothetical protein